MSPFVELPGMEAWRAEEYRELAKESTRMGRPDMALAFIALAVEIERYAAALASPLRLGGVETYDEAMARMTLETADMPKPQPRPWGDM